MIRRWFKQITLKIRAIQTKKAYFFNVFDSFPPFYPESESLLLLLAQSLLTKEQPWANRSCCSLQKNDGSDLLFFMSELIFRLSLTKRFTLKTDERIPNPK